MNNSCRRASEYVTPGVPNCYRFADSAEANDACGLTGAGWVAWCQGNDKVVGRGGASVNVRSGWEKQHMQTWSRSGSRPGKPDRRNVDRKASRWRRIGSNVGLEISWSRWIGQANGVEAFMWCRIQKKCAGGFQEALARQKCASEGFWETLDRQN